MTSLVQSGIQFMQAVGPVSLACIPLLALTVNHFQSSGERKIPIEYTAPKIAEFDECGARLAAVAAAAPAAGGAGGAGEAMTATRLAEVLARAADAYGKTDVDAVEKVVGELEAFDGKLEQVEAIGPSGSTMAEAVRQRTRDVKRHATWRQGRVDVAKRLKEAEDAIVASDIEGAISCLETLRGLLRRFPAVADPEAEKSEPADALTQDEKAKADGLKARAEFRQEFFTLKKAADDTQEKAASFKQRVQEWDALITKAKKRPDDTRDRPLADEAKELRSVAYLRYLEADAMEQTSARQMLRKINTWLEEAEKAARNDTARQRAQELVNRWLTERVKPLPEVRIAKGIQEGYQKTSKDDTVGDRVLGVFQKVPNTERQYRYWKNPEVRNLKKWEMGQDQFNLLGEPSDPKYIGMFQSYMKSRAAFLEDGYRTDDGIQGFARELAKILDDCENYRANYAQLSQDPIDDQAKDWPDILAKGKKAVSDFQAARRAEGTPNTETAP